MRVPLADGTLVATPEVPDADLVPEFLAASDVLGTGWFAAVPASAVSGRRGRAARVWPRLGATHGRHAAAHVKAPSPTGSARTQ